MDFLAKCFLDERGQDVFEYTLLLAFVVLLCAAMFYSGGGHVSRIWETTNNNLSSADSVVPD